MRLKKKSTEVLLDCVPKAAFSSFAKKLPFPNCVIPQGRRTKLIESQCIVERRDFALLWSFDESELRFMVPLAEVQCNVSLMDFRCLLSLES